jgi:hypothetical protein
MIKVDYKLQIASWSVDSAKDPKTEFVALETYASVDSPVNGCRIAVYAPPAPKPSLLQQAVGEASSALGLGGNGAGADAGFSIQIRGQKVKFGDRISVELTSGDNSDTVITAEVQSIHSSFGLTEITGTTGMQKLAGTRVNQAYANQSLNQIVSDLASQAGAETGDIEDGSTYPYFIVHESRSALSHILQLASLEGMDVYMDASNQLTVSTFQKTSADHTFHFGIDILGLDLLTIDAPVAHVMVYGESPASNQGSDTWHWVAKDLSSFRGEAGQGSRLLTVEDRAIRTKDAAGHCATAKLGAVKDHSAAGRLTLMGNPTVKLGDAFEVKDAKQPELNALFKVTSVRHVFSKTSGYLTVVGFSGQGGAKQAGSAVGQLVGQVAGSLGL